MDGVVARLVRLAKAFHEFEDSFTRVHRSHGPFRRSWLLRAVKYADWAEVSTTSCAGRLSFVEVVGEDDDDA